MLLSGLTCTFVGAVTVILPVAGLRFEAAKVKLAEDPGVPDVVEGSVTVGLGLIMVGCKIEPDTAWFTVVALVLLNATLPD